MYVSCMYRNKGNKIVLDYVCKYFTVMAVVMLTSGLSSAITRLVCITINA